MTNDKAGRMLTRSNQSEERSSDKDSLGGTTHLMMGSNSREVEQLLSELVKSHERIFNVLSVPNLLTKNEKPMNKYDLR